MNLKYWYIKFIGLLLVIFGFGYSLTAFYNFFDVLLADKIVLANVNLWINSIGIIFPLFIFIFGMFFYFYGDVYQEKPKKSILICSIVVNVVGIIKLLLINETIYNKLGEVGHCLDFVHPSFAYITLLLGIVLIYGHVKYKY